MEREEGEEETRTRGAGDANTAGDPPPRCGRRGLGRRPSCGRRIPGQPDAAEVDSSERRPPRPSPCPRPRPPRAVPARRLRVGGFPRRRLLQPLHRRVTSFSVAESCFLLLLCFFFFFLYKKEESFSLFFCSCGSKLIRDSVGFL